MAMIVLDANASPDESKNGMFSRSTRRAMAAQALRHKKIDKLPVGTPLFVDRATQANHRGIKFLTVEPLRGPLVGENSDDSERLY